MNNDRQAIAHQVEDQLGCRPPEALLDIWTGITPIDDPTVDVYIYEPRQRLAERNATYQVPIYRPDLLLIGDDGGGRGLFIPRGEADPDVIRIELGATSSDDGEVLGNLAALAADAFRPVRDAEARLAAEEPGTVDVLIARRPEAGVRALVDIRKRFGLAVPISQLTSAEAVFPMVVLSDVYASKYERAITDLDERYHCLIIRPHKPAPA
jgi:hypothetical protein